MEEIFLKINGFLLKDFLENHKTDEDYHEANLIMDYYLIFLRNTDYIPNKLIEAQVLGAKCQDYNDVLAARQFAREEIDKLMSYRALNK